MMRGFYRRTTTVAVAGILLSSLVIAISGQTGGRSAVAIDNDDIGGVVTGPRGPEAGVWVIAETTELPTRLIKKRRHRRSGPLSSCPTCRRRITTCGSAATGSSIRRRSRRRQARPQPEGGGCAGRESRSAVLPGAVLVVAASGAAEERLPGHRPQRVTASRQTSRSQGEWIRKIVNTDGCTGCHQMGNTATRRFPTSARRVRDSWRRGISGFRPARPAAA